MDLRFDAYESRLRELSIKYLHTRIEFYMWSGRPSQFATVLESECHMSESNSISFLSIIPKQQKSVHVSIV
jgi:hypothetical protein